MRSAGPYPHGALSVSGTSDHPEMHRGVRWSKLRFLSTRGESDRYSTSARRNGEMVRNRAEAAKMAAAALRVGP